MHPVPCPDWWATATGSLFQFIHASAHSSVQKRVVMVKILWGGAEQFWHPRSCVKLATVQLTLPLCARLAQIGCEHTAKFLQTSTMTCQT